MDDPVSATIRGYPTRPCSLRMASNCAYGRATKRHGKNKAKQGRGAAITSDVVNGVIVEYHVKDANVDHSAPEP
jgi:hypothetical protein